MHIRLTRPGATIAVIACSLVALASCGDDDPSTGGSPAPATTGRTGETATGAGSAPAGTETSMTFEPLPPRPAPPSTLPGASSPTSQPPTSQPPASQPGGRLDDAAAAAVEHLAERLGVEPVVITVGVDERVTWRDGSLGCPEPGKFYTQALVPGRRLVLSAGGERFAYHAGRDGTFFYCASPDPNGAAQGGVLD